jgi:hypothetical protein
MTPFNIIFCLELMFSYKIFNFNAIKTAINSTPVRNESGNGIGYVRDVGRNNYYSYKIAYIFH